MRRIACLLAVAPFALTGCGGGAGEPVNYEVVEELVAASEISCKEWATREKEDEYSDDKLCNDPWVHFELTEGEATEMDRSRDAIMGGSVAVLANDGKPVRVIIGPNWMVTALEGDANKVHRRLGGLNIDPMEYDMTESLLGGGVNIFAEE